jgi:hypothetical protein
MSTVLQVFGCICDLHKRARLEGMLHEHMEAQDAGEDAHDRYLSVRILIKSIYFLFIYLTSTIAILHMLN